MNSLTVIIANFVTLGVVLVGFGFSHQNPKIIVYTFILSTYVRFITLEIFLVMAGSAGLKNLLGYLSSPPLKGQKSEPLMDSKGKAVGPAGYFLIFGFISYLAFMLMHATVNRKLDLSLPVVLDDLKWGLGFAAVYWVKDLFSRSIVFDARQNRTLNFGYNSSALALLAVAVLSGGAIIVYLQSHQLNPSPWVVCGPLLAVRHLTELRQDLKNWA